MKLLTKEIEKKLKASPLYSKDGHDPEKTEVIVKFFHPYGAGTWYITEGERNGDDWLFFGLCSISNAELGYVALSDLQSIETIERDMYWSGTLADAKKTEQVK